MNEVVKLINKVKVSFMATADGKQPRVRPMAICVIDSGEVVVATYPSPKVKQLRSNPQVEYCVMDPESKDHVRLAGKADLVTDVEEKKRLWEATLPLLPQMKDYFSGPEDEGLIFVTLLPDEVLYMPRTAEEYRRVEWKRGKAG